MGDLDFYLTDSIVQQLNTYDIFLNASKSNDYITPIGFRMLTEKPELLLDNLSKKFDLPFKENKVSSEDVKLQMKSIESIGSRLPRDTSSFRKQIDFAVNAYKPIMNCYDNYIKYKSSLDLSL